MKKDEFKEALEKLLKENGVRVEEIDQYDNEENQCGSTFCFRCHEWTLDISEITE